MAAKRRAPRKSKRVIALSDPPPVGEQREAWKFATALARHWAQRARLLSQAASDADEIAREVAVAWHALQSRLGAAERRGGRPINRATRVAVEVMRILDLLASDGEAMHTDAGDVEPWPLLWFRQQYPEYASRFRLDDRFFSEALHTWRSRDHWVDVQNLLTAMGLRSGRNEPFSADNVRKLWERQGKKLPILQ